MSVSYFTSNQYSISSGYNLMGSGIVMGTITIMGAGGTYSPYYQTQPEEPARCAICDKELKIFEQTSQILSGNKYIKVCKICTEEHLGRIIAAKEL